MLGKEQHKTSILDLIQVIEYLWKATYVFHAPGGLSDWHYCLRLPSDVHIENGINLKVGGLKRWDYQ